MSVPAARQRFERALGGLSARQGRFERLLRLVVRGWCWVMAWHVEIKHHGDLPRVGELPGSGCVVAAAPHRAWVEPFLLMAAWPPEAARLVWLADGRTVTRSWWRRRLLPRLGVIPIEGDVGGPRRYAELASAVLERGLALAVFPEVGPPSPVNRPRPISAGFAYLALRSGAPVVPVVVAGTHHIVRGSTFSLDVLTALETGPAVVDPFTAEGRDRARELSRRLEDVVSASLPARNAEADARAPKRDRWRWLATLFD